MLHMKQPTLAVNSPDVPGPDYTMWETIYAPWGLNASMLVYLIQKSVMNASRTGECRWPM